MSVVTTGLVYDRVYLGHDTGRGHPERADRLRAVVGRLESSGLMSWVRRIEAAGADLKWLHRVHDPAYVGRVERACRDGAGYIDTPDSAVCGESYRVALAAVGGVLGAVDAVMGGVVRNAFCAVRPPGHHADRARSMGFCLFNNAAIAAEYLIAGHGLKRVAIVDFDVHHGNGTQDLFEERGDVMFISVHEHPDGQYPGSGYEHEIGRGLGEGTTINLPLRPGGGDDVYKRVFEERVIPIVEGFAPEALVVSAGFDAARGDPLGNMGVTADGFEWMTTALAGVAERCCGGRLISVLEGGYDLESLAAGVERHVGALITAS